MNISNHKIHHETVVNEGWMTGILTGAQKKQFLEEGYIIVKGVLSSEEIEDIKMTFVELHKNGPVKDYFDLATPEEAKGDPLRLYPRVIYPHRFVPIAMKYMLHPKVMGVIADLLEEEPLAAQSMYYFKPPGGRGQALHQDNYYLRVEPGTCIASWIAIDPADQENGGLVIVPKTNKLDIECPHEADPSVSFFKDEVHVPDGLDIVPAILEAGDALFFNGSMIHGSYPNTSADRFRRSFISHYVGVSAQLLGSGNFQDLYNSSGELLTRDLNSGGGPCGTEINEVH